MPVYRTLKLVGFARLAVRTCTCRRRSKKPSGSCRILSQTNRSHRRQTPAALGAWPTQQSELLRFSGSERDSPIPNPTRTHTSGCVQFFPGMLSSRFQKNKIRPSHLVTKTSPRIWKRTDSPRRAHSTVHRPPSTASALMHTLQLLPRSRDNTPGPEASGTVLPPRKGKKTPAKCSGDHRGIPKSPTNTQGELERSSPPRNGNVSDSQPLYLGTPLDLERYNIYPRIYQSTIAVTTRE